LNPRTLAGHTISNPIETVLRRPTLSVLAAQEGCVVRRSTDRSDEVRRLGGQFGGQDLQQPGLDWEGAIGHRAWRHYARFRISTACSTEQPLNGDDRGVALIRILLSNRTRSEAAIS